MARHKVTVTCDHGSSGGAGLALAVLAAVALIGSGAAVAVLHALLVLTIAVVSGLVLLTVLAAGVVLLVRRRRGRPVRPGLRAPVWNTCLPPGSGRGELPRARAAIESARRPGRVVPGYVEDQDEAPAGGGSRARW
jgi:hypothetical protein